MRRRAARRIRLALELPTRFRRRVDDIIATRALADEHLDGKRALSVATAAITRDAGRGELDFVEIAARYHRLQDALEGAMHRDPSVERPAEITRGWQSKQFMVQLLPYVHTYMSTHPRGSVFTILDVGPGTGHGSNLLASLYAAAGAGYIAKVATLDTRRVYEPYLTVFCRYISPEFGDVFSHARTYDIVIASHVVEHIVEPPLDFCRRLQQLSSGIVIVCAPYDEPTDDLTEGHRHVLDDAFLRALEPMTLDLIESPAWGWFREPRYKMFVAVLPGGHRSDRASAARPRGGGGANPARRT